jgi:two-component system chemotaxis response regulator CheB
MSNRDIVAIGASAGGVEALLHLARNFPADLPASVLMTLHLSSRIRSSLDELLTRAGPLPAAFARDGEQLARSRVYVAPPDRHLLIEGDRIVLGVGPRENNSRPAIDAMLRSVALCCCHRAVGVVLTGTLGDGASGLWAVNQCGGLTVVQDPSKAAFREMPQTALERANPDHVVDLERMPALLSSLVQQPAGEPRAAPAEIGFEVDIAKGTGGYAMEKMDKLGRRSVLSCPECHGVMWEIDEGSLTRYRCHVGHTLGAELMDLALDENLRRALASAHRALEERVALADRLYSQAQHGSHRSLMSTWSARRQEYEQEMTVVRDAILRMEEIAAQEELRRRATAGG